MASKRGKKKSGVSASARPVKRSANSKDLGGPKSSRNRVVHRSAKTGSIKYRDAKKAVVKYVRRLTGA